MYVFVKQWQKFGLADFSEISEDGTLYIDKAT